MRENESEPGDHRDTPGYVNPWTQEPQGGEPGYPPAHYADGGPPAADLGTESPFFGNSSGFGHQAYDQPTYGQPDYSFDPPEPPRRTSHAGRLLIYLLVAAVAAAMGAGATVVFNHNVTASSTGVSSHDIPVQHNDPPGMTSTRLNESRVESRVEPGLVDITATLKYQSETAEGTGMLLSTSGLVLTNNHVIDNSTSVYVSLVGSGRTYQAKVIGYDATDDVALLQLKGAFGLHPVTFGNSNQVTVGTPVLALGNAQGKGGVTPAKGVINALNRSINASDAGSGTTENLHGMQQTTAQIQQGDSGGALANNAGQVIGMVTAANTSSPHPGGTIGFAIPINTALSIARQIASGERSSTVYIGDPGFLGVIVPTSTSSNPQQQAHDEIKYISRGEAAGGIGVPGGSRISACIQNDTQVTVPVTVAPVRIGVLIVNVICGAAVDQVGLQAGDVITAVNGHAVTAPPTLGAYLSKFHPGATVSLSWTDSDGVRHTSVVTLGYGPVR